MEMLFLKGEHSFIYRYESGDEPLVAEALIDQVKETLLEWTDAAIICQQMGVDIEYAISKYKQDYL